MARPSRGAASPFRLLRWAALVGLRLSPCGVPWRALFFFKLYVEKVEAASHSIVRPRRGAMFTAASSETN
jgi:hypothetical protein